MWKGPNEDPGPPAGGSGIDPDTNPHPQLADLKDENEQQQLLIAQLKEIIRKNEQTSVTAEKVEEFANTLAKAKRNKLKRETSSSENKQSSQDGGKKNEGLQNQKVLLMKKQLEENKAKLAARGKSQKGIEDMVVQMKAQLDDSQNLMTQSVTSLNLSLTGSTKQYTTSPAAVQTTSVVQNESTPSLYAKIEQLEAQILDLQENLKEKDSVIDARTKAITLMSENLSKKGKTTLDALDDTKEQMRHMQSSFVETEEKLKSDKQKLLQQIYEKDEQIANLKESNEELNQINEELAKLNDGLQERFNTRNDKSNEEYEKNIFELKEKIKELEDGNKASPSKLSRRNRKSSKQRTYEPNQNTEMEAKITFQQSIIADKQIEIENLQEKVSELEASIQKLKSTIINVKGGKDLATSDNRMENERDTYENQIKELKSTIEELNHKTDTDELTIKLGDQSSKIEKLENIVQSQRMQLETDVSQDEKLSNFEKLITSLSSQVETIEPLQTELDELRSRVKVLQLERQAIEYSDVSTSSVDAEEIIKMKKQLDDHNKNMIKTRAHHKVQMKELQKKLDIFKKGNTEGSDIEKLHEENSKLMLKIAELEEEIGNIQLKMVESTESNSDSTSERKDMEINLAEKIKKIEKLENDLVGHKSQIDALNTKLESLSKFENAKVSSDLNSIQLEEQLEAMEQDKSRLIEDRNTLLSSQLELQDKLDSMEKEKTELYVKVQALVQENMELLDRLEKLSAEKVSSAESIEIVEGLTNQEKLEIEAYQKNLEKQKSEDNLSVGTPELNESVNQLTEETTELLQRIELFTEERREVMEKLEQLASKNIELNTKLKKSEGEKEKLSADKENTEKSISELSQSQLNMTENMHIINTHYSALKNHIQHLKNYLNLAVNGEDASPDFLQNMPNEFEDFECYYKFIVDSKLELKNATKLNENLQSELSECKTELQSNNVAIANLNKELQTLMQQQKDLASKYSMVCQETDEYSDERQELLDKIDDLKMHISDKDENYHKIVQDLKEKCLSLQEEIKRNSVDVDKEPLKTRIAELEVKNKELRDKMKIIAANLKKKSAIFDELVQSNQQSKEKWEVETREKDNLIESLTVQLQETKVLLSNNVNTEEIELVKNKLQQINLTNSEMQLQLNDLLNLKIEHEEQLHLLTQETDMIRSNANAVDMEVRTRDDTISILRLELEQAKENYDIGVNTLQMKVNELEMFIESQDQELTKHKVKVERLEEGLAMVEERRSSLERRAVELGAKLQEREIFYEEAIVNEDNLASRLRALAEHDTAIEKELSATAEENQTLTQQNNQLFSENADLRTRLDSTTYKFAEATRRIEQLGTSELENEDLKQNVKRLESDLTKLDKEFQNLMQKQKSENEQGEMELHDQIRVFNEERKSLIEKCEMFEEQLKEYQEHIESLSTTIAEISAKLQDEEQRIWRYIEEAQSLQEHILELENKCRGFENDVETKTGEITKLANELQNKELEISALNNTLREKKTKLDENLSQLDFAKNMMKQIEESNLDVLGKNDELERKICQLEAEILKTDVPMMQERISQPIHTSALFGSPIDDPFAFVSPTEVPPPPTVATNTAEVPHSNTEPELQNKIRTLEFILYNLEQEKNDLSSQCHKLTDEIAQLIYEKQSSKINLPDVMSQIVPDSEADITPEDNKLIKKSLFVPNTTKGAQSADSVDPGIQAVVELIHAKSAYLCYDQDQSTPFPAGIFGENDDGWGFVVDEPRPVSEQIPVPQTQPTNQALLDQISTLELEREKHLDDLRQAQVKSGKLIKKLKEFKVKNDELTLKLSKKDDGFGDLESAIQDELKSQNEILEKKVKEIQYDLDKEKREHSSLATKIIVLTNANERMVEMKEKQDIEMLGWQQRNRELTIKLDQLEWGSEESSPIKQSITSTASIITPETSDLQKKIDDLNHTIKDLSLDNEELQTMLEEQQNMRLTSDRQKSVEISPEDIKATSEYIALLTDKKTIQEERDKLIQTNDYYREGLSKLTHQLQINNGEKTAIETDLNNLMQTHSTCNIEKQGIRAEFDQLIQIHNQCNEEVLAYNSILEEYKLSIQELQTKLEQAQSMNNESNSRYIEESLIKQKEQFLETENILNASIAALKNNNEDLTKSLEGTRADIQNLNETVKIISAEKLDLQQKLLENVSDSNIVTVLQESIREKQILIDDYEKRLQANEGELEMKLATAIEQITLEWQTRVDQRGNDIAESWKLHVDSKENEFMHLEQQLRKEINELDQKCIGLVNENNELRRNVDAEIRNEVDRVSALQQQINDKQHCINELRSVIDEKQIELNLLHTQVLENESTIQQLNSILQEKDAQLVDFEKEIETRQLDAEDKQSSIIELIKQLDLNEVGDNKKDLEIQECQVEINDLRQEIIAQQQLNNKLSTSANDLNNQISHQRQELIEAREEKNTIASFLDEINSKREAETHTLAALNQQIEQYQYQAAQYINEVAEKENTIINLTSQIESQNEMHQDVSNERQILANNEQDTYAKDELIAKFNRTIQEKEEELSYLNECQELENHKLIAQHRSEVEIMKKSLLEADAKYEALIASKDEAVNTMYNQFTELQSKYNKSEQLLHEKETVLNELMLKHQENESLHNDEQRQLEEMRKILEEQVLKIEELKNELYEKSASYDALFAQVEMPQSDMEQLQTKTEKRVQFSTPLVEDDLSEPVSRAELDLALYMLHQRDVRCEELTLELMQLLEERDTLQLRLSNAIREKEVIRGQQKPSTSDPLQAISSDSTSTGAIPKTRAILLGATNTEMAAEATETDGGVKSLNTKLSELKSVGYRRDKTLLDEQDYRRMQQMSIMNQHIDEASKLPAEAAARLVDANYTLSRDVQSPSKVLLNWLWGRSTPKVNNI